MASAMLCNAKPKSWGERYIDLAIVANIQKQKGKFKMVDGSTRNVNFEFKDSYKDEYTGEELPRAQVQEAIVDELSYFDDIVWKGCTMADMYKVKDAKLIPSRWVFATKETPRTKTCVPNWWGVS